MIISKVIKCIREGSDTHSQVSFVLKIIPFI
jgi:hypothetical protein